MTKLNKILIALCCFLTLLVVISGINHSKKNRYEHLSAYNEIIEMNTRYVPEIIRSYEQYRDANDKRNILFFRYVHTSYNRYDNSFLKEITILQDEIGKEHIWLFPVSPNNQTSRIQLNNDLAGFNYLNIPADSLLIPAYGDEKKCYFAWINSDGEIDRVFLPDGNRILLTRNYFREVKKLLQPVEDEK